MNQRWLVWGGLAFGLTLALALAWALLARAGLDLAQLATRLAGLRAEGFLALAVLIGINTWLSALRWRLIAARTQPKEQPSGAVAFALTALGVGLGQVVPVQLAAALSRSLGGRLFGDRRPLRTAVTTFYEQSFDLCLMLVLATASVAALATRMPSLWPLFAVAALALGLALLQAAPKVVRAVLRGDGRLGRIGAALQETRALEPDLLLRLAGLSLARLAVLTAMAAATSWCAGLDVPILSLAAALPLVALATAAPITPAGLGVNEWTFAAVLTAFGAPLQVAAEWALINRILVAAGSLLVCAVGLAIGVQATTAPSAAPASSD